MPCFLARVLELGERTNARRQLTHLGGGGGVGADWRSCAHLAPLGALFHGMPNRNPPEIALPANMGVSS